MLTIAWPWLAVLLPLPLLIRFLLPPAGPIGGGVVFAPFTADLSEGAALGPAKSHGNWLRLLIGVLIWILLVGAAMRPQWLGEPIELPRGGRNLMLAVDVSESMENRDLGGGYTRLDVVKAVASDFIERRHGDRIGLILYGTAPYLQSPLSFDLETVSTFLQEAQICMADEFSANGRCISRTAIGDAIGLALKRLREGDDQETVLILLTDGVNNFGELDPVQAADLAAGEDLKIYTIGVGSEPRGFFGTRRGRGSLDEASLKLIAEKTGGQYFRARDARDLLDIYEKLDELEPVDTDSETVRPVGELYMWPLGAALLLSFALVVPAVVRGGRL